MHLIEAKNVNEACLTGFNLLTNLGEKTVTDKGTTLTLRHVTTKINNPEDRYLSLAGRNNSLAAAIAETFWIMSGSTVVKGWLYKFLKRAELYSDDGYSWYRGYGRMLYQNNQLAGVIKYLLDSPKSRQAVLSIFDPNAESYDSVVNALGHSQAKDKSCNNLLYFANNNGKLELTVCNRSNDVIFGAYSINAFEFTFIQEIVAAYLHNHATENWNSELGAYIVFSNNYHVYLPDEEAVERGNDLSKKQFDNVQSKLQNTSLRRPDNGFIWMLGNEDNMVFDEPNPDKFVQQLRNYFSSLIQIIQLSPVEAIETNAIRFSTEFGLWAEDSILHDYVLLLQYELTRQAWVESGKSDMFYEQLMKDVYTKIYSPELKEHLQYSPELFYPIK